MNLFYEDSTAWVYFWNRGAKRFSGHGFAFFNLNRHYYITRDPLYYGRPPYYEKDQGFCRG